MGQVGSALRICRLGRAGHFAYATTARLPHPAVHRAWLAVLVKALGASASEPFNDGPSACSGPGAKLRRAEHALCVKRPLEHRAEAKGTTAPRPWPRIIGHRFYASYQHRALSKASGDRCPGKGPGATLLGFPGFRVGSAVLVHEAGTELIQVGGSVDAGPLLLFLAVMTQMRWP